MAQRKTARKRLLGGLALGALAMALVACSASQLNPTPPPSAVVAAVTAPTRVAARPAATAPASPTATASAAPTATPTPRPSPEVSPTSRLLAPQAIATSRPAPIVDPGKARLALQTLVTGLSAPVFATHAGDGSGTLYILEKAGRIRVWNGSGLAQEAWLDIHARVGSGSSEQGLLGLAFAPDFPLEGRFYLNYTDLAGDTVISRWRIGPDGKADVASEELLLRIDQPAANHNGGMLAFGPDGMLYVGMGDGGRANDLFGNGQNPSSLLGKLLRLDVATSDGAGYRIPADNPWVDLDWAGKPVLDEVWAVGLRNPWRFSFDRLTGDLWIADVGQNRYEEVDRVPAGSPGGLNFGWPITEGQHCFPESAACDWSGLVMPVAEYSHDAGDCSITGGYVYRGMTPGDLAGAYLYGDYCSGRIWAVWQDGGGAWQTRLLLDTELNISSFAEDEAGELYVLDLRGGVYRLVAEGGIGRALMPLILQL